MIIRASSNL